MCSKRKDQNTKPKYTTKLQQLCPKNQLHCKYFLTEMVDWVHDFSTSEYKMFFSAAFPEWCFLFRSHCFYGAREKLN